MPATGEKAWGALRAFDPFTGAKKWEFKYFTPPNGGCLSTAGGVVFAGDSDGNFVAVRRTFREGSVAHPARRGDLLLTNDVRAGWQAIRCDPGGRNTVCVCVAVNEARALAASFISDNDCCGMKISILVPLYNEEEFVATLLERVIAAPLPEGFEREIIVADDGSRDASVQEVEAVAEKYPGCNSAADNHAQSRQGERRFAGRSRKRAANSA